MYGYCSYLTGATKYFWKYFTPTLLSGLFWKTNRGSTDKISMGFFSIHHFRDYKKVNFVKKESKTVSIWSHEAEPKQILFQLFVVLVFPAIVMIFSYGRIIFEVCRVFRQRERLTNGTARACGTNRTNVTTTTNQPRFSKNKKTCKLGKKANSKLRNRWLSKRFRVTSTGVKFQSVFVFFNQVIGVQRGGGRGVKEELMCLELQKLPQQL